jgi:hypothetical protein
MHASMQVTYLRKFFYLHAEIRMKTPYVLGHVHMSPATGTQASNQRHNGSHVVR